MDSNPPSKRKGDGARLTRWSTPLDDGKDVESSDETSNLERPKDGLSVARVRKVPMKGHVVDEDLPEDWVRVKRPGRGVDDVERSVFGKGNVRRIGVGRGGGRQSLVLVDFDKGVARREGGEVDGGRGGGRGGGREVGSGRGGFGGGGRVERGGSSGRERDLGRDGLRRSMRVSTEINRPLVVLQPSQKRGEGTHIRGEDSLREVDGPKLVELALLRDSRQGGRELMLNSPDLRELLGLLHTLLLLRL